MLNVVYDGFFYNGFTFFFKKLYIVKYGIYDRI
jgi:hypothetical protein